MTGSGVTCPTGRTCLLLAVLGSLPPAVAAAGPPASRPASQAAVPVKEITLDEIVVTGEPETAGTEQRTVGRGEIERQGARNAAQVLEHEPSIHATTGSRGERIFTFRGFDQRQVVVLVDGAPAYIPYDGQADLSYLPAEMIDHISIVKGPASVLYGPNGLGGAVNIVTRRPGTGPLLSAAAEYGRAGSLLAGGMHSARFGRLGYTLFGGMQRRDAFPLSGAFAPVARERGPLRENSDSLLYHVGCNLHLELPRSHQIGASVAYIDGDRGVPPGLFDRTVQYWRFSVWRSIAASLGHSAGYLAGRLQVDELAYVRLYDNLLDSYDDATYTTQLLPRAFSDWFHDQLLGGRVRARYRFDRTPWGPTRLRLWAGAQHDRHDQAPTSRLVTRSLVTVAPEAEAFFGERWSLMVAFQSDLEIPGAASRVGHSARVGLGPLLTVRYEPLVGLSLRATAARRTRFPTLKDRFSTGQGARLPNPDLGPESAWHMGLELAWQARRWLLVEVTAFDAEVADLISVVSVPGGEQLQNIPGARLLGAELSAELRPWKWLGLRAGYNYLRARSKVEVGGSDELEYRPDHKAGLQVILAPWRWVEWSNSLRVIGPRPYRHPATELWQSLDAHARWDTRLTVRPTPWSSVYLQVSNLLDGNHDSKLGYPEPGRELWVGARVARW